MFKRKVLRLLLTLVVSLCFLSITAVSFAASDAVIFHRSPKFSAGTNAAAVNNSSGKNVVLTTTYAASSGKDVIQKLTSVFENSTAVLQYTYIENINDGRGYTFGFPGFCSGTYDGTEFLKEYQRLNPNNTLVKYIPTFEKIDKMSHPDGKCSNVQGLENFPKDFKACGNDSAFVQAQQNIVDKDYWNPSQKMASKIGAKYLITQGELYDTFINHGEDGANNIINKTTQAMGGSPASGVDEKAWLDKFLQIRLKVLQADPTWAEAVDRVKVYQKLLSQGNVNLNTPMTIKCYGDTFTIK